MAGKSVTAERVAAIGEDYDSLKPNTKRYLDEIDKIVAKRKEIVNASVSNLKNTSLTVSAIAEMLNCSRTTLYNKQKFLVRYIEKSIAEAEENNPFTLIDELENNLCDLRLQISAMMKRDVNEEIMRHEIEMLQKLNAELRAENNRFRANNKK